MYIIPDIPLEASAESCLFVVLRIVLLECFVVWVTWMGELDFYIKGLCLSFLVITHDSRKTQLRVWNVNWRDNKWKSQNHWIKKEQRCKSIVCRIRYNQSLVSHWACAQRSSKSSASMRGPSSPQMGHSSALVMHCQQRVHPGWFSATWVPPWAIYRSDLQRVLHPKQAT